jgi:hypothetical protein
VQAFLDQNADPLAGVVKTGARQQLADAIAVLSGHASDQTGSNLAAQGATLKQRALREALLRDHMAPISRVARADLPVTVELEPFKMPQGKPTVERLAAAATGMAKASTPFASVFDSAGLPLDFVAQLKAATDAMLASGTDRMQRRGLRTGATQGLRQKLSTGRRIVHVLDVREERAWDIRHSSPTGMSSSVCRGRPAARGAGGPPAPAQRRHRGAPLPPPELGAAA